MPDIIGKGRTAAIYLALTAITVVVFWPSLQSGFVNYDDPYYIYTNPSVYQGLTWKNFIWAFTTRHASNWHPLTWLSHMIDCGLYGPEASWHHLTSLLVHVANANLLLLLLRRMTGALWRSAFVAALFAIHPLHVESVAWLSERKDVLSTFFLLLTLLAYVRYVEGKRLAGSPTSQFEPGNTDSTEMRPRQTGSYWIVILCFAAGLMCKPMIVTVPFVMLLLDYWPLRRIQLDEVSRSSTLLSLFLEKVPLFILSGISCMITLWAQSRAVITLETLPFAFRLWNAVLSYARYMFKAVWPMKLAVFYPYPTVWLIGELVIICVVLLLITFFAIKSLRKSPYVAVGWFWFLGTLAPVIGLVHVGIQSMADRYTYVPLIGLFLILSWGAYDFCQNWPAHRILLATVGSVLISGYALLGYKQVMVWRNSETLFVHAINVTRPNVIARYNLGVAYLEKGKMEAARDEFTEAARINPSYSEVQNNLANILSMEGKLEESVDHYEQAIKYRPDHPNAHYNLACTLTDLDRLDEAILHFNKALEIQPQLTQVHKDLGVAFRKKGQFEAAKIELQKFTELEPNNAEGHLELACLFAANNDPVSASNQLQLALNLKPNLLADYKSYADTLARKGKTLAASRHYKSLLSVDPDNLEVRQALAVLLADAGKTEEAIAEFQQLLRIHPDGQAHYSLGLALAMAGRTDEAIANFRKAIELRPDWPLPMSDLAWILATDHKDNLRNGEEAVRLAERACELTQHKEVRFLGTLDAAYAEMGRFKDAIETGTKTHQLAVEKADSELAKSAETRIELYRAGRPFHQE